MILDILKLMGAPLIFFLVLIPSVRFSLYLGDKIGDMLQFRKLRSWLAWLTYFVTMSWSLILAILALCLYVEKVK